MVRVTVMSSSPVFDTVISYSAGLSGSASRELGDADIYTSTAAVTTGGIKESNNKIRTKRVETALFMIDPE